MHSFVQGHPSLILAIKQLERLNPDHFEIYFEHRTATQLDSKNNEIDSLIRSEDVGIAIRLLKDHKLGFSFTTSLEKESIEKAVHTALEIASLMPEDTNHEFFSFGSAAYPAMDNYDASSLQLPLETKIQKAKQLESLCRSFDSRITGVRSASLKETVTQTCMVDSNGEFLSHKSLGYTAGVTCKAEIPGESQVGSDSAFSNELSSLSLKEVAENAARHALELLGASSPATLRCPAVMRNAVVADLIDFLSASFSAEHLSKGKSMLSGKQGQPLFSEAVTLVHDGLLPGGPGSSPFDAEGVPSKRTVLVDGGFLNHFLYDLYYAKKLDKEPTSSSIRRIKTPPSIGFANLYLENGKKSYESLFDGIHQGVLITNLMGLHTANPITGDFSVGASGIQIEKGKLTRPLRGFAVAGNLLDLFRKITDISNDMKFFGRIGAPSVRVSELAIGGK